MAKVGEVNEGDKVTTTAEYDVNGVHLMKHVRETTYTVSQIGPGERRIVLNYGDVVVAAVDIGTVTVVSGKGKTTKTERVDYKEYALTSKGIEDGLKKLLNSSIDEEWAKYTTRLFGAPHQFQHYCDYRTFSYRNPKNSYAYGKSKDVLMGRTFITNIMMEAPIVTFIPGKPIYLPAASNKQGITRGLLQSANKDLGSLKTALNDQRLHEKLRYYDFQQDYYNYMKYVNLLCSTSAAFLDLGNKELDGVPLTKYDWKNYRWTASSYSTATGNLLAAGKTALSNAVDSLKTYGKKVLNFLLPDDKQKMDTSVKAFEEEAKEDPSVIEALESLLTQNNFVQFYVDASSGLSESAENSTDQSKFQGMMESANEMSKEIQFLINSGGVDAEAYAKAMNDGIDAITEKMLGEDYGTIGGVMSRITSGATNVIQGETMLFPEIYQSSKYNKNYSIIVDLRTPYGNKFSYYMNILVPLFHIIALTVPRQATANTYSSPFLVKAYYPGIFSCNLGIIQSIQIDKAPSGDGWTVDGFPTEVKVTINLVDLYSDLNISPSGDVVLFLANSSLIEYIATSCGVNLITPQLGKRIDMVINTVKQSLDTIVEDTINIAVLQKAENFIASLVSI